MLIAAADGGGPLSKRTGLVLLDKRRAGCGD
ncbi:hypothetical protein GGQ58_003657 [Paracoccus denitrificans]|jgi:hypothetical protein|nr:hypothetical protein [Paracoccus denitrificans]